MTSFEMHIQFRSHAMPKSKVQKFNKIEIISCIFSKDKILKPQINYSSKASKTTNLWSLNSMLLKPGDQCSNQRGKLKNTER